MLKETLYGGGWCRKNMGKKGMLGLVECRQGLRGVGYGKASAEIWLSFSVTSCSKLTRVIGQILLDVWWYSREPLSDVFPSCFSLAQSINRSVFKHMICLRVLCSWDLKPRRNLNDWEIEEMGRLLEVLDAYPVGDPGLEDEMI